MAILSVLFAQLLYTASDVWKKIIFRDTGFGWHVLLRPAFVFALLISLAGYGFQLYALSRLDLSRTIISLGMLAVILSGLAGVFILGERLNPWNWLGVALALAAVALVNIK